MPIAAVTATRHKGEDVAGAISRIAGFVPHYAARVISWALGIAGIGAKGVARSIRIANSFTRRGVKITVGVSWTRRPLFTVEPRW